MVKFIFFVVLSLSAPLFSSIVAIEGMSGAGKSSSVVSLYPGLSGGFVVLPELNPEPTVQYRNKTPQEQTEEYFSLWLRRMKIVKRSIRSFLFDRSYFGALAFVYALDRLEGTKMYSVLLEQMRKSFNFHEDFERIIILDVDPAVSIERRIKGNMDNYWPWNSKEFLKYFREFYLLELPTLTKIPLEYIFTTGLTQSEVRGILGDKLGVVVPISETSSCSLEQERLLFNYVETCCLGRLHSHPVLSFGYLSIITETHCVQLDENELPVLLDNDRLERLVSNEIEASSGLVEKFDVNP